MNNDELRDGFSYEAESAKQEKISSEKSSFFLLLILCGFGFYASLKAVYTTGVESAIYFAVFIFIAAIFYIGSRINIHGNTMYGMMLTMTATAIDFLSKTSSDSSKDLQSHKRSKT